MGITSEDFFKNIYNIMFSPKDFFESENNNTSIRLAIGVIFVMTIINNTSYSIANNSIYEWKFPLVLIFNVIGTVLMWFLIALFFEFIAKIFNKGGNLAKLLYFTAFASVPSLFFAPLNLLKQVGELGYILSVTLGCFLYIWMIILYAFSVKSAYNITLARAFMFIFLPMISSILAIYQIVGFCHKMWYIFSV